MAAPPMNPAPYRAAMKVPAAPDLSRALTEARSIADGVGQELNSAHLLLALFTVPNPAEVILREHAIDEDRLLDLLDSRLVDAPGALKLALQLADETALRCDARQTNTLHLLVALLKVRDSSAYTLLEKALGNVAVLRNRVMSFVTGVLPRRLMEPMREAKLADTPAPEGGERIDRTERRPVRGDTRDDWVVPKKTMLDAGPASDGRGVEPRKHESRISILENRVLESEIDAAPDRPMSEIDDADVDARDSAPGTGADRPFARADTSIRPAPALPAAPARPAGAPQTRRRFEPQMPAPMTMPPTDYDLDPERFPWLTSLGKNLSALAVNGGLDMSIGREPELEQLIDVLGKRRANNPCLVGEPGVGKTAIVEGLAVRLVREDASVRPLFGKIIIELDMGRIVAGTALRGSFSERMQGLKRDVQRAKGQVIVFIDEIHTLMGAGSTGEGPQDAANELKQALARGDFPCIGSTTSDEFKKHVEQDPALERRFVKIVVEEPDDATTISILKGAAPLYVKHHGVSVDDDAIYAAVQLSSRFIHDKRLPAKALDLLDLTLSRGRRAAKAIVKREDVARVCADIAKVPLDRVLLEDGKRFMDMERFLRERVIGHTDVVGRVANTIRRNYAGFTTHRPLGSFLFLGPSGVGKTELAKALADFLFGTDKALVRLDMSEYSEPHTVARLLGAPPGYVGHQDGGQLTEAVRQRPHCVVLLDEIEKAHPDVLPVLLQILDEGRLTDSRGRTVTFRHALLVMTSNLGALAAGKQRSMGFGGVSAVDSADSQRQKRESAILDAAKKHFAPELWGRIEDKMVFGALEKAELMQIAGIILAASSAALETTRNIALRFDDAVLSYLVDQGDFDVATGARPMRQLVQRLVETPVSEAILRGEVHEGARIRLEVKDGRLLAKAQRAERRAG